MESQTQIPLFFSFFLAIYLFGYFVFFRSWPSQIRPESSSCLISLFHGTPTVFLGATSLLSAPASAFSSPNTAAQNTVLDFSISYFLADLSHYLLFYPKDILFILHHVATLFVLATCRFLVLHGAFSVITLLVLAELTSACQNAWTLARARRGDSKIAVRIYVALSPPFYAFYSLVRGLVGPWFVYKMSVFYARGGAVGVIPKWVWVSWVGVVVVSILVSIVWVWNLWVEFFGEKTSEFDKGKKKL